MVGRRYKEAASFALKYVTLGFCVWGFKVSKFEVLPVGAGVFQDSWAWAEDGHE